MCDAHARTVLYRVGDALRLGWLWWLARGGRSVWRFLGSMTQRRAGGPPPPPHRDDDARHGGS